MLGRLFGPRLSTTLNVGFLLRGADHPHRMPRDGPLHQLPHDFPALDMLHRLPPLPALSSNRLRPRLHLWLVVGS